uniref:Uncharacterized protein n=1 Tax=Oryza meridionalis TaxID=40149 RepID=A0A0E0CKB5_9ORYZ
METASFRAVAQVIVVIRSAAARTSAAARVIGLFDIYGEEERDWRHRCGEGKGSGGEGAAEESGATGRERGRREGRGRRSLRWGIGGENVN